MTQTLTPIKSSASLFHVNHGKHGEHSPEKDVYNPALVLDPKGLTIFARRETDSLETDSHIVVGLADFGDKFSYYIHEKGILLDLHQDPFHCGIFTDHRTQEPFNVFGAVKIYPGKKHNQVDGWETNLFTYRNSIYDEIEADRVFEPFYTGPWKMKGIRPIQLPDGSIGCFVRPQRNELTDFGGDGTIAYLTMNNLSELEETINRFVLTKDSSKFVSGLLRPEVASWGGVNRVSLNPNGTLTLSYHVAYRVYIDDGHDNKTPKRYEAWAAIFDPRTERTLKAWQIADAHQHFSDVRIKDPDLRAGILYPDGFYDSPQGRLLITGIGDTTMGAIRINESEFDTNIQAA